MSVHADQDKQTRYQRPVATLAALAVLVAGTPGVATGASRADGGHSDAAVQAANVSLEIDGDSTLHRYHARAGDVRVTVGIDAAPAPAHADLEALIRGHQLRTLELVVAVNRLSSGDRGLDEKMRETLKGKQYPEIRFRMGSYDVLTPSGAAAPITVVLHGSLRVAGVERRIDIGAAGSPTKDGLSFEGSKGVLMTDYGIRPPRMILGAITAADLVTVRFRVTLRSSSP